MATHNQIIQRSLAMQVTPRTQLQDAMNKMRLARRMGETEFELAYGELFILMRDVFGQRNHARQQVAQLKKRVSKLEDELRFYKENTESVVK